MTNVIIVQSCFAVAWLLTKKVVYKIWGNDKEAFEHIKEWYYWFEYILLFTATVLTPKHTLNEGIATIFVVVAIKIIMDRFHVFDKAINKYFDK